jgi:hypothetical protein
MECFDCLLDGVRLASAELRGQMYALSERCLNLLCFDV